MLFRLKCYLVSVLALGAVAAFVVTTALPAMMWLADQFPNELAAQLLGIAAWFVGANIVFLLIVRLLKCPACERHFNWRNYFNNGWLRLFPARICPTCHADMYAGHGVLPPEHGDLRVA